MKKSLIVIIVIVLLLGGLLEAIMEWFQRERL